MKPILFFIISTLTLSSCVIYKCPPPGPPPPPSTGENEYYKDSCAYWNRLPFEYRMSKIPFKGAAKIEVVSFEDFRNEGIRKDTTRRRGNESVIPKDKPKEIDYYNTFFERFSLSQNDIDTLSQILNFTDTTIQIKPLPKGKEYDFYSRTLQRSMAGCFNPHHALLFYAKNGEQYARWDFCFHCNNHEIRGIYYTKNTESFTCYGQSAALQRLFKRIGITKFFE